MPLWPGPDRKLIPVSRIWIETPEQRFERELAAGRSPAQVEEDRRDVHNRRITRQRLREQQEQERQERERAESIYRDPFGYYPNAIWQTHRAVRETERALAQLIREARGYGLTWQAIANAMELSRQAVHKRYGWLG
jgi:hypothetical protein